MKSRSKATIAIIHALKAGKSVEEIAKRVGVTKQRVYQVRHKLKQQSKEEVRGYVRKTPKHPEKLQKVGAYVRGAKTQKNVAVISGEQMNAFTQFNPKAKFVPPRSLDLADALIKNQDLYNEIKDQQAIIRYLENLVVRLTKSN